MPRPHCFLHENPKFAANQPQNFAMRRARIQRDSSRTARRGCFPHIATGTAAHIPVSASPAQPGASIARPQRGYFCTVSGTAAHIPASASLAQPQRGYFPHIATGTAAHPRVRFVPRSRSASIAEPGAVILRIATGTAAQSPRSLPPHNRSASIARPQRVNRKAAARLFSASRQAQRRASPRSLRPRSPARQSQSPARLLSAYRGRHSGAHSRVRFVRTAAARQSQSRSAVIFPHHR